MDRHEPTLAPQWLKASGSSSNSDEHNNGTSRNRLPLSISDNDAPRASSPSLSSHRSVNNSTTGQDNANYSNSLVYRNFGRRRDRDRLKDRNKDRWEKDTLIDNGYSDRRSNLMGSTRRVQSLPKKIGSNSNITILSTRTSSSYSKVSFEEEFPTLGIEEKQRESEITRVSSPGISAALSSLHLSSSSLIGGDGWTSALAEVPVQCVGNGISLSNALQTAMNMSASSSNVSTGLSMAETLAQAPLRARTTSPSSGDNERQKELTLKQQYTKLIPIVNSSEKAKLKASKNGDIVSPKLGTPQHSSHLTNQAVRSSPIKPDVLKTSVSAKFHVLIREGTSSNNTRNAPTLSVTNNGVTTSSNSPHPIYSANNSKTKVIDIGAEKNKNPLSQSEDRKKFFDLLRGQAKMKNGVSNSEGKTNEHNVKEKTVLAASNSDIKYCTVAVNGNKNVCDGEPEIESLVAPDEEERAFLESLGWNPNIGEDALTAEEIESFVKKHEEKLGPDFKYKAGLPHSK